MSDEVDLHGRVVAERYRVVRKLGSGGMGSVWEVQHVESLERFALKALHPRAAQQRMTVERFVREARAAAALHSRHVVKVIDAQRGYVDPQTQLPMPFLVMELLEGTNLDRRVVDVAPLTPAELAWVLKAVGRALSLAHAKGIVHRDLKPENVFLALDDERQPIVKVCDFGIAKVIGTLADGLLATGASSSSDDLLLGTPMYMSPEQIRDPTSLGPPTDQWALGLLAYKALVGKDYFGEARTTGELLGRILGDSLDPPSKRAPQLDAAFDEWFLRSCHRDAAKRFANVQEQVDAYFDAMKITTPVAPTVSVSSRADVESAATGAPLSTGRPRSVATTKASAKRSTWLAIAGVVGVLSLGGWMIVRATQGPPTSASAKKPEPEPVNVPASATPTGPASATTATVATAATATAATTTTTATTTTAATASATATTTAAVPATAAPPPTATTLAKPTATTPKPKPSASATVASKRPAGAPCMRGAECASGYCFAEQCQ